MNEGGKFHSDEGLTLETSALKLDRGQFTLSNQLIILNYPISTK